MSRLLALVGIVGISFSAIFVRLAETSPSTAAVFRGLYAVPPLVVLWWLVRRQDHRPWRMRVLAGLSGVVLSLDLTLWHRAIEDIGAGLATVLANTQVVFVAMLSWWLLRERPARSTLAAISVVLAGVTLISGLGGEDSYGTHPLRGALLGTGAGIAYSGFILLLRHSNQTKAPSAGPMLDSTLGLTLGAAAFGLADPGLSFEPEWPAHGWLLALAWVAQVAGWLLITHALPRLAALDTSVLLLLQPTLTVIWGMLIFRERLGTIQWGGATLVLAGVTFVSWRGATRRRAQP